MADERTTIGESERWLSVIVGGMLALSSLRRRDLGSGFLFALGGAALIFRGLAGHDGLARAVVGTVRREIGGDPPAVDPVTEAGLESFPASDPPSWTPTAGPSVGEDLGEADGDDGAAEGEG